MHGGDIAVQVISNSTSLLGGSTNLHCSLASKENVTITGFTWRKRNSDGSHTRVAVFHPKNEPYFAEPDRVKFLADKQGNGLRNASLAISNVSVEDEGTYECQIATFPRGTRSASVWLNVLARPNNTAEVLEPSPSLTLQDVAKCISADGHPPGRITWSSNVNGSHREMEEPGSQPGTTTVTSYYSMVPSRQADGKNITCIVEHESSREPDRLPLTLSLPYPPVVSISGYDDNWHVGLTNLSLTCDAHSKPAPHSYDWNTTMGFLPTSTKRQGNQLLIPTLEGLNNTIFVCKATNALGSGQSQQSILVKETPENVQQNTGLVIGSIIAIIFAILSAIIVCSIVWKCKHGRPLRSRPVENNVSTEVQGRRTKGSKWTTDLFLEPSQGDWADSCSVASRFSRSLACVPLGGSGNFWRWGLVGEG
ncbi:nectin-2-like isoform X2 [Mastomys coucha]|uniref:nectin-2-like isoform X2 n=1 Tax=Mastomys coucha TaxID=35658 RepID=UPI0012620167|nr:nectin-2-like isoform X2 [Mastomys coucha]